MSFFGLEERKEGKYESLATPGYSLSYVLVLFLHTLQFTSSYHFLNFNQQHVL